MLEKYIEKELISEQEIKAQVKKLANIITEEHKDHDNVLLVGVLTGAFIFTSDLMRELDIPCVVDFISASSYGSGTESSGNVVIAKDIKESVRGKHVIICEELIDTGNTLQALKRWFARQEAESVKICALLNKEERRQVDIHSDYPVIEIPNEFVVGYGLDYAGKFRNYKCVCVLKKEVYEK